MDAVGKNTYHIPWLNKGGKHLGIALGDHNKYFKSRVAKNLSN